MQSWTIKDVHYLWYLKNPFKFSENFQIPLVVLILNCIRIHPITYTNVNTV